jgi:3-hydroxyisobutyrate dehydrogenase-like beta-hydroxyacid dehydrogenase
VKVAVLGTGIMGAPIARNLAAAGADFPLPRLSEERMRRASELGHGDDDSAATIMASLRGSAS